MKKLLLVLAATALLGVFQKANAQFKVGGGLNYATKISTLGISAQGAYDFTEEWGATASFTYYLEKDNASYSSIDVNANYTFTEIENVGKMYGIAGINHFMVSVDTPKVSYEGIDVGGGSYTDSKTGVNLGLGLKMDLSEKMLLCPELIYSSAYEGRISFGAKLMFKL